MWDISLTTVTIKYICKHLLSSGFRHFMNVNFDSYPAQSYAQTWSRQVFCFTLNSKDFLSVSIWFCFEKKNISTEKEMLNLQFMFSRSMTTSTEQTKTTLLSEANTFFPRHSCWKGSFYLYNNAKFKVAFVSW